MDRAGSARIAISLKARLTLKGILDPETRHVNKPDRQIQGCVCVIL